MHSANGMGLLHFVLLAIHVQTDASKQQRVRQVMVLNVGFHKNIFVVAQSEQ